MPAGAYFVWPVRRRYGDVVALTATAQPITQLDTDSGLLVVFGAIEGIDVELEIDAGVHEIRGARRVETAHGARWVPSTSPGPDCVVTVGTTRLVILDPVSSRAVWRGTVGGRDVVALWTGGVTFVDDRLVLERWTEQDEILAIPASTGAEEQVGPFHRQALPAAIPARTVPVHTVAEATAGPATRRGGTADRLSAPHADDWHGAAVFEMRVPVDPDRDAGQVLSIDWVGDVARAYLGEDLVADQFWYGRTWEIDVRHLPRNAPLRILILPWNGEADWFVDRRVRSLRVPGRADILTATLLTAPHHSVTFPAAYGGVRATSATVFPGSRDG